ncbi:two-component system chemotaxis sensor kinase CheA [Rhodovulum bhavnagarense]|uniref:histidine kinase n=1 Tax=Rhodovulum bhavnagarense TaxID=992286 RepID=A0A4R2RG66_9RHOB|nr:Hpt domain-containing protein [Rhodovulum bhavnagarense]TCP61369.1 two-component system chemotaxis sensor kinase CheA [Rhodovulum bhavnagarense]
MSDEMDEIWALFADDGGQALDAVEAALMALRQDAESAGGETISALFRGIHTFKGNARVLGLATIESRAHVAEDLIGLVRDDGVALDEEILDLLIEVSDELRLMLEFAAEERRDADPAETEDLLARLKAKIADCMTPQPDADERAPQTRASHDEDNAMQHSGQEDPTSPEPTCPAVTAEPPVPDQERTARLFDDPTFRRVFEKMARKTLDAMTAHRALLHSDADQALELLREDAAKLRNGAAKVGLTDWISAIDGYLDAPEHDTAGAEHMIAALERCRAIDLDGDATPSAPALQPVPVGPAPAPEPGAETRPGVAPAEGARTLGASLDDPTYRRIFIKIARETLDELRQTRDEFTNEPAAHVMRVKQRAGRLRNAAGQMGLSAWTEAVDDFAGMDKPEGADLDLMLDRLSQRFAEDIEGQAPAAPDACAAGAGPCETSAPAESFAVASHAQSDEADGSAICGRAREARDFLEGLEGPLAELAALGERLGEAAMVSPEEIAIAAERIVQDARAAGFGGVADVATRFGIVQTQRDFRDAELDLYEQLVTLENAFGEALDGLALQPLSFLRTWCAENAYATLMETSELIDDLRARRDIEANIARLTRLLRRINHACRHYQIETAAYLAMSLFDLFDRAPTGQIGPDTVLLHIARSFVDLLEVVFDAIDAGETPDTEGLERLFDEASRATFVITNAPTAAAVEERLGLPDSFHRVLSPESVKAASRAMDLGQNFFIVRTDFNDREDVAQAFLQWLESGQARLITSVTVFVGEKVLFDFLLCSRMSDPALREALSGIDPTGKLVHVDTELPYDRGSRVRQGASAGAGLVLGGGLGSNLREELGEIVAGHSRVHNVLLDLLQGDLGDMVAANLPAEIVASDSWRLIRGALERAGDDIMDRLRQAQQTGSQLQSRLVQLQEDMIELGQAEAEALLQALAEHIAKVARSSGRRVAVTLTGQDTRVDDRVLSRLYPALCALLEKRLTQDGDGPHRLHVWVHRKDDSIGVGIEDDMAAGHAVEALETAGRAIGAMAGDIRQSLLPGSGTRLTITLPVAMVVMEGMVVRDGEVSYIVPTDAIHRIVHCDPDQISRISAEGDRCILKLGNEEIVDIGFLQDSRRQRALAVIGADRRAGAEKMLFLIVGHAGRRVAIMVEDLVGQQVVLVRPLRGALAGIRGMTGCALLGNGDVGLALAVPSLFEAERAAAA